MRNGNAKRGPSVRQVCAGLALVAAMVLSIPRAGFAGTVEEDFRIGLSAFNAGDFPTAYRLWRPWAEKSDPRSEQGIGFMYHRGLSVEVDDVQAAYWFRRAAEHGQGEGQLMLGALYFFGEGVPQSNVEAYAWCDLAQANGQEDATMCRDAALGGMTSDEEMRSAFKEGLKVRELYGRR